MRENDVAKVIVDVCLAIHKELGPGLLESVYAAVLADELRECGLEVSSQVALPVYWKDRKIDLGYRIDLLVCGVVIVEVKSVETLADVHYKQLLTYLRLADKRLGILVNFNSALLKGQIKRIINGKIDI